MTTKSGLEISMSTYGDNKVVYNIGGYKIYTNIYSHSTYESPEELYHTIIKKQLDNISLLPAYESPEEPYHIKIKKQLDNMTKEEIDNNIFRLNVKINDYNETKYIFANISLDEFINLTPDKLIEKYYINMKSLNGYLSESVIVSTLNMIDGRYGIPPENVDIILDNYFQSRLTGLTSLRLAKKYNFTNFNLSELINYSNLELWSEFGDFQVEFNVKTVSFREYLESKYGFRITINDSRYSIESLRKALDKGMNIIFDSLGVITDPELLELIPKVKDGERSTLIAFLIGNPLLPEIAKRQGIPQKLVDFRKFFNLSTDESSRLESIGI